MKEKLALFLYYSGISLLMFHASRLWYGIQHIRVINYHTTPARFSTNFERQLTFFKKYYCNVNENELLDFLNSKKWPKSKPGLILSFDDGLKNNLEVAIPLLEKYGFTAWLCIPPEYVKEHQESEKKRDANVLLYGHMLKEADAITMSYSEIKEASKNHIIVCHTATHRRLQPNLSQAVYQKEIVDSKRELEQILSSKVNGFCWVGGELENYSAEAQKLIKENYSFSLQTNNYPIMKTTDRFFINRNNIEVWFSFTRVILTICGFYDFLYARKRSQVKKKLIKLN